jgi:hypothetical protein
MQAEGSKLAVSRRIVRDPRSVHVAVDLGDQLSLGAVEVDDEATDRVLPPKAPSVELAATQALPERAFGKWSPARASAGRVASR